MKTILLIPILFLLGCASKTGITEQSFGEAFAYGLLEDGFTVAVMEIVAKNPETRDEFITVEQNLTAAIESGSISVATLEQAFRVVDITKLSREGRIGFVLAKNQFRRHGARLAGVTLSSHLQLGVAAMRDGLRAGLN